MPFTRKSWRTSAIVMASGLTNDSALLDPLLALIEKPLNKLLPLSEEFYLNDFDDLLNGSVAHVRFELRGRTLRMTNVRSGKETVLEAELFALCNPEPRHLSCPFISSSDQTILPLRPLPEFGAYAPVSSPSASLLEKLNRCEHCKKANYVRGSEANWCDSRTTICLKRGRWFCHQCDCDCGSGPHLDEVDVREPDSNNAWDGFPRTKHGTLDCRCSGCAANCDLQIADRSFRCRMCATGTGAFCCFGTELFEYPDPETAPESVSSSSSSEPTPRSGLGAYACGLNTLHLENLKRTVEWLVECVFYRSHEAVIDALETRTSGKKFPADLSLWSCDFNLRKPAQRICEIFKSVYLERQTQLENVVRRLAKSTTLDDEELVTLLSHLKYFDKLCQMPIVQSNYWFVSNISTFPCGFSPFRYGFFEIDCMYDLPDFQESEMFDVIYMARLVFGVVTRDYFHVYVCGGPADPVCSYLLAEPRDRPGHRNVATLSSPSGAVLIATTKGDRQSFISLVVHVGLICKTFNLTDRKLSELNAGFRTRDACKISVMPCTANSFLVGLYAPHGKYLVVSLELNNLTSTSFELSVSKLKHMDARVNHYLTAENYSMYMPLPNMIDLEKGELTFAKYNETCRYYEHFKISLDTVQSACAEVTTPGSGLLADPRILSGLRTRSDAWCCWVPGVPWLVSEYGWLMYGGDAPLPHRCDFGLYSTLFAYRASRDDGTFKVRTIL